MTKALAAFHDATYGGVYYCANIDFTNQAAVPVWTKLSNTGLANTLIKVMQTDYEQPYDNIYVQLDNDDVYIYNGAGWTKILDLATARTLSGLAAGTVGYIAANKTVAGRIYISIANGPATGAQQVLLKSSDYGASWTAVTIITYNLITGNGFLSATGEHIWLCYGHLYRSMQYSANNGTNWYGDWAIWGNTAGGDQTNVDPLNGIHNYYRVSAADSDLDRYYYSGGYGQTELQNGKDLGAVYLTGDLPNTAGSHYFSKTTSGYQKIIYGTTRKLYSTIDAFANLVDAAPTQWDADVDDIVTMDCAKENELYTLFGRGGVGNGLSRLWAWVGDDTDDAPWSISGANFAAAPYTNSFPSTDTSYVAIYGVFVGEAPASSGIEIYSVEHNAYDTDHTPKRGDRSSWRDMDADTNDAGDPASYSHAEDIYESTPQRHNLWPVTSGNIQVSDGSKWTESTPAAFGIHNPVTLDADAATILDLSTQEIGLDVQNANTVLAGPTAGAANEPTFRALVLADLPAIDLDDLADVNTAGVADGDAILYDSGTSTWLPSNPKTRKVDTLTVGSYTLDGTYDVVIVDATDGDVTITLPIASSNDGQEYTIKRVDSSANVVMIEATSGVLTDSDGEILTDSDGETLTDSDGTGDGIDGEANLMIENQYTAIQIVADGDADSWWII